MVRTESEGRLRGESSAGPLSSGQGIALCVLALLTMGVVMVNSAGMSVEPTRAVTIESLLLSRSTIYMGLAMLALFATAMMPVRRLAAAWVEKGRDGAEAKRGIVEHFARLWPLWVFVLAMFAVLGSVYLPGIGKEVNNSHRWVNLRVSGLESVQPSEIAKWALIIAMAWYCCRNARHMSSFLRGLIPGLMAAGAVSAFIVMEDLGTGALLGVVACLMLIAAGARVWHLALLAPLPIAAFVAAIVTSPYRVHRILAFLNPYEDPQGIGYHMIQSMVAVANGQFFGRGLGHGLQKFGYLPEDTTDFLFAIIGEELGVFGAGLVIFLYGMLLWCVLGVIKREPSRFLKLVALGVMATVGIQAMINLGVVTGLAPTKGIALPLLSSGGTGWILTAASLGLVIAMDRTRGQAAVLAEAAAECGEELDAQIADESPVIETAGADEPADDSRFAPASWIAEPASGVENGAIAIAAESEPTTEPTTPLPGVGPSMLVAPGETGLLFSDTRVDETDALADAEPAQPPATPQIVITEQGRDWPPPLTSVRITPA